jgi:hypothetical protein
MEWPAVFFETFYCGGAPHSLILLNSTKETHEYNIYKIGKKEENYIQRGLRKRLKPY